MVDQYYSSDDWQTSHENVLAFTLFANLKIMKFILTQINWKWIIATDSQIKIKNGFVANNGSQISNYLW